MTDEPTVYNYMNVIDDLRARVVSLTKALEGVGKVIHAPMPPKWEDGLRQVQLLRTIVPHPDLLADVGEGTPEPKHREWWRDAHFQTDLGHTDPTEEDK